MFEIAKRLQVCCRVLPSCHLPIRLSWCCLWRIYASSSYSTCSLLYLICPPFQVLSDFLMVVLKYSKNSLLGMIILTLIQILNQRSSEVIKILEWLLVSRGKMQILFFFLSFQGTFNCFYMRWDVHVLSSAHIQMQVKRMGVINMTPPELLGSRLNPWPGLIIQQEGSEWWKHWHALTYMPLMKFRCTAERIRCFQEEFLAGQMKEVM